MDPRRSRRAVKAFVIDASVAGRPELPVDDADLLFAPELVDIEVTNHLRKSVLRGQRDAAEAAGDLAAWAGNDVKRFSHAPYLSTVWELRHTITPYDATYVALAMHLGATLLTADRRLAAAARSYCDVVEVS